MKSEIVRVSCAFPRVPVSSNWPHLAKNSWPIMRRVSLMRLPRPWRGPKVKWDFRVGIFYTVSSHRGVGDKEWQWHRSRRGQVCKFADTIDSTYLLSLRHPAVEAKVFWHRETLRDNLQNHVGHLGSWVAAETRTIVRSHLSQAFQPSKTPYAPCP